MADHDPAPQQQKSHSGLYFIVGALVAVVILIVLFLSGGDAPDVGADTGTGGDVNVSVEAEGGASDASGEAADAAEPADDGADTSSDSDAETDTDTSN